VCLDVCDEVDEGGVGDDGLGCVAYVGDVGRLSLFGDDRGCCGVSRSFCG
jgi:hypothetical protein